MSGFGGKVQEAFTGFMTPGASRRATTPRTMGSRNPNVDDPDLDEEEETQPLMGRRGDPIETVLEGETGGATQDEDEREAQLMARI